MSDPYSFESRFEAGLFRRGDPKARKKADIAIGPDGIRARAVDGTEAEIAWRGIRLTRDESGTIYCIAPDRSVTIYSEHPDFLRALETAGGNDINDAISRMQGDTVSNRMRHNLSCLILLLVVAAGIWVVPRVFRRTVDGAVSALPYSVDEAIGEQVFANMDMGGEEVTDEDVRAAIQEIIDRLEPHSPREEAVFTFKVIDSEVVNAFALPGGYIVVFTGLITEADGPEQVAGVLAHEMAHVTERHGLRRIAHSLGLWAGISLIFGGADVLSGMAVELFTIANVNSYSQDQETDADLVGTRMMIDAKIDPSGLSSFFEQLAEEHGDIPASMQWFSTHPQHRERVEAIDAYTLEYAGGAADWVPLDLDWEAVRAKLE